jgi:hypothetical protein
MAALKTVNIEFGTSFLLAVVTMTDNRKTQVLCTYDEEAREHWMAETLLENDPVLESYCQGVVRAAVHGVIEEITKE